MHVAAGPGPEGEDLGAALGHLVVAALFGLAAPPVAAGEPLPAPLLQRLGAIGIHGGPLLAVGGPTELAPRLGTGQIGAGHGDELIEIHPVHPARHHIRDVLTPHGIILARQAEDEIGHDHRVVVTGQLPQPGQQGLPIVEAGRLLAHLGIKALYPEREAVEAARQRTVPLGIIKTVEAPLQGHLRIRSQRKTTDGGGQHRQLVGAHVRRRAAPHIDGREGAALGEGCLGRLDKRTAERVDIAGDAGRVGAIFKEIAEAAALAAKRDVDIERPLVRLALAAPPGLPVGMVEGERAHAAATGVGRGLGAKGELEGIRGGKTGHGRGQQWCHRRQAIE